MRAILAVLSLCFVFVFSSAEAHVGENQLHASGPKLRGSSVTVAHHHRQRVARHRANASSAMLAPGLLHMLQSMPKEAPAWPNAETMGARYAADGASARPPFGTAVGRQIADDVVQPIRHLISDPRPREWCGWYMRQLKGVADRAFNLAAKWVQFGRPARGPAPGVIVVWRHHVGEDHGPCGNGERLILSGNDGHAVRERCRSLAGVIALREP